MPFLKEQIGFVNAALKAVAFADSRFVSGRYETIAYDVVRTTEDNKKEIFPAVMDAEYLPVEIVLDDKHSVVVYHKALSSKYDLWTGKNGPNQYGQGNENIRQLTQVKMVVYANYSQVKLTREALEALIIANFPDNFVGQQIKDLKLTSCKVTPVSTDFNTRKVWQEEYQGFDLRLSAEDILFAIYYTLETIFTKGCFHICDC